MSAPKTWRKKPVDIQAMQWDRILPAPRRSSTWMIDSSGNVLAQYNDGERLIIETMEGDHTASSGNWIIRGVKGEFHPCKSDICEMTYEQPGEPTAAGYRRQARAAISLLTDELMVHKLNEETVRNQLSVASIYASLASSRAHDEARAALKGYQDFVIMPRPSKARLPSVCMRRRNTLGVREAEIADVEGVERPRVGD